MCKIYELILGLAVPVAMVLFGVASNAVILVVFMRRRFKKSLSRNFFCLMSLTDTISLLTIFAYNRLGFEFDILTSSSVSCALFTFMSYFFPALSSWLLMLINIERYLHVTHKHTCLFAKTRFQLIMFCILIVWHFGIYFCLSFHTRLVEVSSFSNATSNKTQIHCEEYSKYGGGLVLPWLDTVNSFVAPLFVMAVCVVGIIRSIYLSKRILSCADLYLDREVKRMRRETCVSIVMIILFVAFFLFNLPVCLSNLIYTTDAIERYPIAFLLIEDVFYCQYITNIFAYLALNAKFKEELYRILQIKVKSKKFARKQIVKKVFR